MGPSNSWGFHHPSTSQGGYDAVEITIDDPFQIRYGSTLLFEIATDGTADFQGNTIQNFTISGYVKTDGSTPLTANWDVGSHSIRVSDLLVDGTGGGYDPIGHIYNPGGDLMISGVKDATAFKGTVTLKGVSASMNWDGENSAFIPTDTSGLTSIGDSTNYIGTITAEYFQGGLRPFTGTDNPIFFLDDDDIYGHQTAQLMGASSTDLHLKFWVSAAPMLDIYVEDSGNGHFEASSDVFITAGSGTGDNIYFQHDTAAFGVFYWNSGSPYFNVSADIRPGATNYKLGISGDPWDELWANGGDFKGTVYYG